MDKGKLVTYKKQIALIYATIIADLGITFLCAIVIYEGIGVNLYVVIAMIVLNLMTLLSVKPLKIMALLDEQQTSSDKEI